MNDSEWFDLIQKICDEKGVFFPVENEPALSLRYISCMELKSEILNQAIKNG
jgi:hypothetical protein